MGPFEEPTPNSEDIKVNVPANTSPGVVQDILNNLPNIFGALGGIFGWQQQQQQQPQQPQQDLTPVYLLGGAIILILLTRK
jgi:hypothetical protein